ncbi:MAG: agmatine deiminase family protein [Bacteroidota bacterium]
MNVKSIIAVGITLFSTGFAQAQQTRTSAGKLPAYRTEAEKQLSIARARQKASNALAKASSLPSNIRYPGEFEESQSVVISWSYDYDGTGNVTGADVTSEYAEVSANLAAEIQKVVPVIIRVTLPADSTAIKEYMVQRSTPLTNYEFMVALGEDWWTRDFGPNGIYYGDHDSLGFIDLKYYDGRDHDNAFPIAFAKKTGKPNYISSMHAEGGNLMADGFGGIFFSDVITTVNNDIDYRSPVWTKQQTLDSTTALFAGKQLFNLKTLLCDGGTGHIDLYVKMIDEQTIMASQYPDEITAVDKQRIEDNLQLIASKKSTYNRPFRIYRIPHPTDDNGKHTNKTCPQINEDARTFVNGLSINDTYIMPSYSDKQSGNVAQTEEAKTLMRKIMPGYKVVDIDSRLLSVLGGEIHCITMQVPAENPVLFWHPSVDGYYPEIKNAFHIIAKITNRSGIATARCMWRVKGQAGFQAIDLADSSGYFKGDIQAGNLTATDEIEYYITATTNNGKTATKPLNVANGGYYNIHFMMRSGVDDHLVQAKNYLFNAYPNPASTKVFIPFYSERQAKALITITDITGKQVKTLETLANTGLNEAEVNTDDLNNGIYFYTYTTDGNVIATRKFTVHK